MDTADDLQLTDEASRLLKAIVDAWPRENADVALDANAIWVGKQIGLTEVQVGTAVDLLASKDLLHVRRLHGLLMVHPTARAIGQSAARATFAQRFVRFFRSRPSRH